MATREERQAAARASLAAAAEQQSQRKAEAVFSMGGDGTQAGLDQYVQNTEYVQKLQGDSDKMLQTIGGEISSIKDTAKKSMLDIGALTGELKNSFESTRNDVMNMVQASSQKAALEMDAYLGSAGSDTRSAVRRNMVSTMTTGLVSQAQQGLSALYKDYSKSVVDTALKGTEINNQTMNIAYDAIVRLTDQSSRLLLGTASTVMSGYSDALKASLGLMNAKNDLARLAMEREQQTFNQNMALEEANWQEYNSKFQTRSYSSLVNNPAEQEARRRQVLAPR